MRVQSRGKRRGGEAGLSLIELMIAMVVLASGLIGLMAIILAAIQGNGRNKLDTTSTVLSQMVIEQLSNVPATQNRTLTLTDCAGTSWTINSAAGGASVDSNRDIDFTTSYTTSGYSMRWVNCGANGKQATYDVRWHIYAPSSYLKVVVVSTRLKGTANLQGTQAIMYATPVQLKSILGS